MTTIEDKTEFLRGLRTNLSSFSRNQRKIALYCLDHCESLPFMTSLALAEASGVSQPSVSRFVQVLGFRNFEEFKKMIGAVVMRELSTAVPAQRFTQARHVTHLEDLLRDQQLEITALPQLIRGETFQQCVGRIAQARRIVVIGMASAAPVAVNMHLYLYRIREQVHCVTEYAMTSLITVSHFDQSDCAVVFAVPRYTSDTLRLMEQLRARGVSVVLITDRNNVDLTPLADFILTVPVIIGAVTAVPSTMLTVSSVLVEGVALRNAELTLEKLNDFEEGARLSRFFCTEP